MPKRKRGERKSWVWTLLKPYVMAGKAYTMQEMRDIVDYLVQRDVYAETRARTMWINFANSGKTKRTWQSLKETFLKRILPDIHNPYYNLTQDQILSFRKGINYVKKSTNKLEIQEVPESSKSTEMEAGPSRDVDPVSDTGENVNGKDICSSTDTNESKFAEAEEVRASVKAEKGKAKIAPVKSLKDRVAAALTPVMSVIDDWDSDNSDKAHERPNKHNAVDSENTVSTTTSVSQDTLIPKNREVIEHSEHSKPIKKTRSQSQRANADHYVTRSLKSANKINENEISQPRKKNVRLSEVLSELDDNVSTENRENLNKRQTVKGVSTKFQTEKIGNGAATVEELLAVLTGSNLPNNQEELINPNKDPKSENSRVDSLETTLCDSKSTNSNDFNLQSSHTQELQSPEKQTKNAKNNKHKISHNEPAKSPQKVESTQSTKIDTTNKVTCSNNNVNSSNSTNELLLSEGEHNKRTPSPIGKNTKKLPRVANTKKSPRLNKSKVIPETQMTQSTVSNLDESDNEEPKNFTSVLVNSSGEKSQNKMKKGTDAKSLKVKKTLFVGTEESTPDILSCKENTVDLVNSKESLPNMDNYNKEIVDNPSVDNQEPKLDNIRKKTHVTVKKQYAPNNSESHKEKIDDTNSSAFLMNKLSTASPNINPCLQSASLFEENHFLNNNEKNKPENQKNTSTDITENYKISNTPEKRSPQKLIQNSPFSKLKQDLILLNSQSSGSDSSTEPIAARKRRSNEWECAKLFGHPYTGHGVNHVRGSRSVKQRGGRKRNRRSSSSSESSNSESTEPSRNDFIPLPCPRGKNKRMRRPVGGRVKMLQDGALVAICGGKLYSLVAQRGNKVYTLKYNPPEEADNSEVIAVPSNSAFVPSTSAVIRKETGSNIRVTETKPSTEAAAPIAAPPPEKTCLTLTKDKITLAGDMDQIMSVLPKLQQVMRGLRAEEAEGRADEAPSSDAGSARRQSEDSDEIRTRVNAREAEIFKEITERHEEMVEREEEDIAERDEEMTGRDEEEETQSATKADPEPRSSRRKRPPVKEPPAAHAKDSSESETEIIIQEEPAKKKGRRKVAKSEEEADGGATMVVDSGSDETLYALPPEPAKVGRRTAK